MYAHGYEFPDSTFNTGHSLGGGISLATIEYYPQYYHGALLMCSLSSRHYLQIKLTFDINAVFSEIYPNTLPSLAEVLDGSAPPVSMDAIQKD